MVQMETAHSLLVDDREEGIAREKEEREVPKVAVKAWSRKAPALILGLLALSVGVACILHPLGIERKDTYPLGVNANSTDQTMMKWTCHPAGSSLAGHWHDYCHHVNVPSAWAMSTDCSCGRCVWDAHSSIYAIKHEAMRQCQAVCGHGACSIYDVNGNMC